MLDERFIYSSADGKKYVYLKICDIDALSEMKNGKWWLRHSDYFRYEDIVMYDKERGDNEDSFIEEQLTFKDEFKTTRIKLYRPEEQIDSERILCLYRLDIEIDGEFVPVDKRMSRFGNNFAFVDITQLLEDFQKEDAILVHFNIKYKPENYSGIIGIKWNSNRYKHQNEHRILLSSEKYNLELQNNENVRTLRTLIDEEV